MTKIDINSFNNNGYTILKSFFSSEEIDLLNITVSDQIKNRCLINSKMTVDILTGELAGERLLLKDTSDTLLQEIYKLNDLHLESEICRNICLDAKLCDQLKLLLNDNPVAINSLTFNKGSQQPYHFDTYYMPPPTPNKMVVTSICLEDQKEGCGLLTYYPGSHKLPPYIFSNNKILFVPDEMALATQYIEKLLKEEGISPESFMGEKGDVFIWHAQLYHGGQPVTNKSYSRKTLVTHYWSETDVRNDIRKTSLNTLYWDRDYHKPHLSN